MRPVTRLCAPEQVLADDTNYHNVSPDDRLAHEDKAVTAGQADGGAHCVVPASHQAAVYRGLRHLTPGVRIRSIQSRRELDR